jgi:hypothetical protein
MHLNDIEELCELRKDDRLDALILFSSGLENVEHGIEFRTTLAHPCKGIFVWLRSSVFGSGGNESLFGRWKSGTTHGAFSLSLDDRFNAIRAENVFANGDFRGRLVHRLHADLP